MPSDEWRAAVARRVRAAGWRWCVVVDDEDTVLGVLQVTADMETATLVEAAMRSDATTMRPQAALETAVQWMRAHRDECLVITTPDGRLVGLLSLNEAPPAAAEAEGAISAPPAHRAGSKSGCS